jgi:DNA-binding MarR family transcriptional regulator
MTTEQQAEIHRCLSNPDRIAIMDYLALLAKPQASVSEIAIAIKNAPTNAVKHLAKLEKVGLITRRRDNQTVWNSIAAGVVWPLVIRR